MEPGGYVIDFTVREPSAKTSSVSTMIDPSTCGVAVVVVDVRMDAFVSPPMGTAVTDVIVMKRAMLRPQMLQMLNSKAVRSWDPRLVIT
jgi:hypothetical protein